MGGMADVRSSGYHVTNGETEAQPPRVSDASKLGSLPTVTAQEGSFSKCMLITSLTGWPHDKSLTLDPDPILPLGLNVNGAGPTSPTVGRLSPFTSQ